VDALYQHLGIEHNVWACYDTKDQLAHEVLLDKLENYFAAGDATAISLPAPLAPASRINKTLRPPVYIQHSGHSLTVVGLERHRSGRRCLVVLDPTFSTTRAMRQFLDVGVRRVVRPNLDVVEFYRRGGSRLHNYDAFEIVMYVCHDVGEFANKPQALEPASSVSGVGCTTP
jgi:zinc finger-containing ubiquitin peptidase 1